MVNININYDKTDGTIGFETKGAMTIAELICLCNTVQFTAMKNLVEEVRNDTSKTEEDVAKVKEAVYDLYNAQASDLLHTFAPEIELRPDLTVDAIMRAENEILSEVSETAEATDDTEI